MCILHETASQVGDAAHDLSFSDIYVTNTVQLIKQSIMSQILNSRITNTYKYICMCIVFLDRFGDM